MNMFAHKTHALPMSFSSVAVVNAILKVVTGVKKSLVWLLVFHSILSSPLLLQNDHEIKVYWSGVQTWLNRDRTNTMQQWNAFLFLHWSNNDSWQNEWQWENMYIQGLLCMQRSMWFGYGRPLWRTRTRWSIHFLTLIRVASHWQYVKHGSPDVPLLRNVFQLLLGFPEAFSSQMRCIISPACSGSIPGSSTSWMIPENFQRKARQLEKFIFHWNGMNSNLVCPCLCALCVCDICAFASVSTRVCGFHGKAQQPSSPTREGGEERKEVKNERERGRPLFTEKQR